MDKEVEIGRRMMNADGFLYAANCLRDSISKDGTMLGIYGPAYTANLAFACELYLKQLYIIENRDAWGHEIKKLFEELDESDKQKIIKEYENRCNDFSSNRNVVIRKVEKLLEDYNTAFEDWRYWFEGGKASKHLGWCDFHIFINVIRDMVMEFADSL